MQSDEKISRSIAHLDLISDSLTKQQNPSGADRRADTGGAGQRQPVPYIPPQPCGGRSAGIGHHACPLAQLAFAHRGVFRFYKKQDPFKIFTVRLRDLHDLTVHAFYHPHTSSFHKKLQR